VSQAEAGLCIEPENEEELLEAIEKLSADRALARRLGESGYERIASRYTYDRLANEYAELLGRLLAGRGERV
jgi:glycosyltransferase involved in cell wall biosynthesis